jgi:hypothetical protein
MRLELALKILLGLALGVFGSLAVFGAFVWYILETYRNAESFPVD